MVVAVALAVSACGGGSDHDATARPVEPPLSPAADAGPDGEPGPVADGGPGPGAFAPPGAGPAPVGDAIEAAPAPPPGPAPGAVPVRVEVPRLDIGADLVELGLNEDRTMEVPEFEVGGWYGGAPRPGEVGPAVIVAHVDSYTGPAPFFRLGEVRPGDRIVVRYDDGSRFEFAASVTQRHAKETFPTQAVYGNTTGPELRLITCGGDYDRSSRSYLDNVIVWARRTQPRAPAGVV